MPDQQKKSQKQKSEPKEQRKPKQGKQQQTKKDLKVEQPVTQPPCNQVPEKPAYEEPPPEFYKSLKRETDEILKITEEADAKYKKKEIQSNWAKYEMPIESYDEIDEQENMGADFEQLMQASMSVGGHFQFKHEKSWDLCTAPSLYDKYFDINCDDLATALYTIPFYERNCIDKNLFSEPDIQNMNGRTNRFKQKYFNKKTCKDSLSLDIDNAFEYNHDNEKINEDTKVELKLLDLNINSGLSENVQAPISPLDCLLKSPEIRVGDNIDDIIIFGKASPLPQISSPVKSDKAFVEQNKKEDKNLESNDEVKTSETNTNRVMETPEDLEKWLDDFLDG